MKNLKLKKVFTILLLVVLVLALNSIGASAEWKQDNIGWWYTEGSSWSVGWRLVDGKWYYFGQDGYMKTGWLQDINGEWYYLNSDGSMAHDATIGGYTIGPDGAWNQRTLNSSQQSTTTHDILSNINLNATTISGVTGIRSADITKIIFYDGRGVNKPVIIEDKQKVNKFMGYLDSYVIKKSKNSESTGWIQSAQFYVNDKVVMDITFVYPIIINGDYFNIIKGKLDNDTISKFLKSIDSSYDIMAGL
jgi:hypothetical protein